ncbi:MAG: transposase [Hyphomicrobiales bacterium]|nr:transposase [Hyphomicrobiales bacterium]
MATRIIDVLDAAPAGPRRRFSEDDKARIVSEAMMPGVTVAEVGRRYGVCGSLIYRWRRTLIGSSMVRAERSLAPPAGFVPVEVAGPVAVVPEALSAGVVEVLAPSGLRVRFAPPIDARVLKAVLAGLT